MDSYGIGIGRAWCCRKACERYNLAYDGRILNKEKFLFLQALSKQQTIKFWFQNFLGIEE